jgi:hypothetical protein
MGESPLLLCDGCGQAASSVHLAKRFQRLEWATRYRPVHIGTVLLGAVAPARDADFLYSPGGEFGGEGGRVLEAAGISRMGRSSETVLVEFQRRGLFLTYVLECPIESGSHAAPQSLLNARFAATAARVRRSLRPKRVVPISRLLEPLLQGPNGPVDLGSTLVIDGMKAYPLADEGPDLSIEALRRVLVGGDPVGGD